MDNANVQIKQMRFSDFAEVLSLWEKAGLTLSSPEQELADTKITVTMNPASCLVLIKSKKIIGGILGTFNGRRGWIYHLAVHPDFQQEGYGSLLLEKVEKELKKLGAHRVHLGVSYKNLKVLPFYEKSGYKVVNDALWLGKNI